MRKFFAAASIGLVLGAPTLLWAGGDDSEVFKDTLRAMQERIKQLEDEVQRLKSAPPPAPTPVATAPEGLENRVKKLEDGIGLLNGIKFGGMVYGSYNYNFNNPDSKDNSLRVFDTRANNFTLDLAQLSVSKEEEEGGVGFKLLVDYGHTAGLMQSDWTGDGSLSNGTNNFALQEAYVTYTAGIGKGLGIKAGKFVTLLGAEVIESPLNYNISRSFLFGYAIPFTHTGVLFSYPLMEQVSLSAGIVNGWDNVIDSNKGKSFLGNLTLQPVDILTLSLNGVYGAELPDRGGSKRGVFDFVGTLNVTDHTTFVTNFDYGTESETGLNGKDADWYGIAGYLNIDGAQFHPDWEAFSIAQRLEWFDDEDGVRTGTKQDLWEATTTLKYKITDNLHFRAEYRHDNSDKRVFSQRQYTIGNEAITRFLHGQDTVAAELAYLFY